MAASGSSVADLAGDAMAYTSTLERQDGQRRRSRAWPCAAVATMHNVSNVALIDCKRTCIPVAVHAALTVSATANLSPVARPACQSMALLGCCGGGPGPNSMHPNLLWAAKGGAGARGSCCGHGAMHAAVTNVPPSQAPIAWGCLPCWAQQAACRCKRP